MVLRVRHLVLASLLLTAVGCAPTAPPDSEPRCGDGQIDASREEVCDDGENRNGDGCSADCLSKETCGNGILDVAAGEACDDGNTTDGDGCSADCRAREGCPNGIVNAGETCDDGNVSDTDNCLNACVAASCGDGRVDTAEPGVEACDDGNTLSEESCPYGTAECTRCNADCTATLALTGPRCGDGVTSDGETCDDGNTVTETRCDYGTPECGGCDAACETALTLQGTYCGDGQLSDREDCDDGNGLACGTCSADCDDETLAPATGTIQAVPSAYLSDGDFFLLGDGTFPEPFVFRNMSEPFVCDAYECRIDIAEPRSGEELATVIGDAIEWSGLQIDVLQGGAVLHLTNRNAGSFGNQEITHGVLADGFVTTGMAGGMGRDCGPDTGCTRDEDCAPGLLCRSGGRCGE